MYSIIVHVIVVGLTIGPYPNFVSIVICHTQTTLEFLVSISHAPCHTSSSKMLQKISHRVWKGTEEELAGMYKISQMGRMMRNWFKLKH